MSVDDKDPAPIPGAVVRVEDTLASQASMESHADLKVADLEVADLQAKDFWAAPKQATTATIEPVPTPETVSMNVKTDAKMNLNDSSEPLEGVQHGATSVLPQNETQTTRKAVNVPSRTERPSASTNLNTGAASVSGGAAVGGLEQVGLAFIAEQRNARRWKIFFRFLWAFLILWIFIKLGNHSPVASPSLSTEHTAVVSIEDAIASDSMASSQYVLPALQSAFEEKAAKAVVLLINSPGGSPVQAGIIYDEIKRLKEKHKKPVYAVVEESATSAAYYIAVAADQIYVNKASIVGSIGVLMDGFGATELMKKVGVERRLLTAGEHKGILDPFSPQSETDVAYAKRLLDQIHQQFIATVREGRKGRLKEGPDTFSGLFWSGEEAIGLGLVDKIGSLDFVAREVVKADEIVNYSYQEGVAERLVKRFGAAVGHAVVQSAQPAGLKVE